MGAALRRIDVIDKAVYAFRVGIVVLQSNLNENVVFFFFLIQDIIIQRSFAPVQVADKFPDSSLIVKGFFLRMLRPGIPEYDFQALRQKGHLTETLL